MSDILDPQGYEPNEAIEDNDSMEIYQPSSGGVRRNKDASMSTLRDYFKKLPAPFTPNNLVQADGTGTLKTTLLSTTEVSNTVTRSQNNESAIGVLDGRVDGNDTDIGNLETRMTNTESATGTNTTNIGNNDTDISNNASAIGVNAGNISDNDTDIGNNASAIGVNSGKITDLENLQPTEVTDDVVFNSVNTDNVALKHKKIVTNFSYATSGFNSQHDLVGSLTVAHGLDVSKITGFSMGWENEELVTDVAFYTVKKWDSTNIVFEYRVFTPLGSIITSPTSPATLIITYEA